LDAIRTSITVLNESRVYFCKQLSDWLYVTEWHFTTLTAVCLESIKVSPANVDHFINCLLLSFPAKPPYPKLVRYVNESAIIEDWFCYEVIKPSFKSYNLDTLETTPSVNHRFPQFDSLPDLAYWLGVSFTQLQWLADPKRDDILQPERYKHYHYRVVEKRRV